MWQFVERFHVPTEKQNFMDALREQYEGGFKMSAYKDKTQGTWYVSFRYIDWTGKKTQKLKRGFKTKKEALNYEKEFIRKTAADMKMEMNSFITVLMDAVMKDEDIPSDCYIKHQAEGIDIICSNIGLAGTEVQLVNAMSREYVLKQILYGIKDQYDAVIIDCMPSLGMITINALAASDEVLIPVEASYLPIKGLQQLLKTIGKVRKQINPKLQVGGILFTMVDAHTNDARNNMELLRNAYGSQIHIFDNYIPFSVRMKEAVREGQSIFSYDPKSKATEAYRRVTEEVLEDAI